MTKLYVGNLPYNTTNQLLQDHFAQYGTVLSADIIMDKFSGRSKGFGFVEMEDDAAAQAAIEKANGADFSGRNIVVSVARPKEDRPRRDFGGNGGGRDFRGGGDRGGNRGGYGHDR
ncbi:MAG: RNA-binding protein [Candidatus Levybacteria bacterium]|nr:RNA-binding protein [Candidatus Levybacteria bacterium]MBP9814974.1 RNA-binding protein [Candidatus Levybacteria bacterium]